MAKTITTLQAKQKKFKWWAFFYVLAVLFCFYPYEFYSFYLLFLPNESYITAIIFLFFTVFLMMLVGKRLTPTLHLVSGVVLMQLFGFFITGVAHANLLPVMDKSIYILLALALVSFVCNCVGLVRFYEKYNRWILIMAILGCVTFFMVELNNFQPLYFVLDRADGRPIYNYLLTFSRSDEFNVGIMRYAGFFDEPGAMAYWGIYALVINRLFIRDKWFETILGIALLFTLSVGYFIQYAAFLLLFYVFGKNKGHSLIIAFLILAIIGGISMTRDTADSEIYDRTFGRIENMFNESRASSNTIAVGDRATYTENAIREFKEYPLFGTPRSDVNVGNNVYETLAMYGVVGSFFILFPFLLLVIWGFMYKDLTLLKCSIVILLGFTHRPFHANILYFFVIYSILVMYKQTGLRQKSASQDQLSNS